MEAIEGKSKPKEEVTYCICKSKDDKRFMICCDGCNNWFHGDCINLKSDQAKKIKHYFCQKCLKDKKSTTFVETKQKSSASTDSDFEISKKKTRKECGNCIGCFRNEDCGKCDLCKANNKLEPGSASRKQKCRLRQCVISNFSSPPKPSSPKKKMAKESNNNLKLKNVAKKKPMASAASSYTTLSPTSNPVLLPPIFLDDYLSSPTRILGGSTRAGAKAVKNFIAEAGLFCEEEKNEELRQCLGPGCVLPARRGSKYCSDETCGLKLARVRLLEILPGRLQQWNSQPTIAEEFERKRLDQIEVQMEAAKQVLDDLAAEEEKLNLWVEHTKSVQWDGQTEADNDDDESNNIYCPTCGHETSTKNAMRHINRCFSKYENQTSFGSANRTFNNVYQIFCDTFNKTSGTYCKRLRVICPEHHKEAKVDDEQVCGAVLTQPALGHGTRRAALINNDLKLDSEFCRVQKKTCLKHYKWEKIRRAVIDTERLAQLLKLDELYDEQRALKAAVKARGNVLALLLHQTVKHDDDSPKKNS